MIEKRPLIFIHPLPEALKEFKELLEKTQEEELIEIYELDDLKEYAQLLPTVGLSITLISNTQKCARLLQENKDVLKKSKSKLILFSQSALPNDLLAKLTKFGLSDFIKLPLAQKNLLFKIRLIIKATMAQKKDVTKSEAQEKIEFKASKKETVIKTNEVQRVERGILEEKEKGVVTNSSKDETNYNILSSHYSNAKQLDTIGDLLPKSSESQNIEVTDHDITLELQKDEATKDISTTSQRTDGNESLNVAKTNDITLFASDDKNLNKKANENKIENLNQEAIAGQKTNLNLNLLVDPQDKKVDNNQEVKEESQSKIIAEKATLTLTLDKEEIAESEAAKDITAEDELKQKEVSLVSIELEAQLKKTQNTTLEIENEQESDPENIAVSSEDVSVNVTSRQSDLELLSNEQAPESKQIKQDLDDLEKIKDQTISLDIDASSKEKNTVEIDIEDQSKKKKTSLDIEEEAKNEVASDLFSLSTTAKKQKESLFELAENKKELSKKLFNLAPINKDQIKKRLFSIKNDTYKNKDFTLKLHSLGATQKKHNPKKNNTGPEIKKQKVVKLDITPALDNTPSKEERKEEVISLKEESVYTQEKFDSNLFDEAIKKDNIENDIQDNVIKLSTEDLREDEEVIRVYAPQTRGIEILIAALEYYNQETLDKNALYLFLESSINKQIQASFHFYYYRKDKSLYEKVNFSNNQENGDDINKILNKNLSTWTNLNLPWWQDEKFEEEENSFVYPFYEGTTKLGVGIIIFNEKVKEEDVSLIEAIIEMARGAFIAEYDEKFGLIKHKSSDHEQSSWFDKITNAVSNIFSFFKKAS